MKSLDKALKSIIYFILFSFSFISTAMAEAGSGDITVAINTINSQIRAVVPIVLALAVLYFLWGVVKYITAADADLKAEGKRIIVQGIVGLLIIVSLWVIVDLIGSYIGVNVKETPSAPAIPQ